LWKLSLGQSPCICLGLLFLPTISAINESYSWKYVLSLPDSLTEIIHQ
jgi:hypothetical protein